jgi:hypothetical protein
MSRWFLGLTVLVLASPVVADDAAQKVVKKGIEAHGGAATLNRLKAGVSRIKGDLVIFEMNLEFSGELAYELPDKYRMRINTEINEQKAAIVQVVNGNKILNTFNGMALPVKDAERAELVKALKDENVAGKPAAVVLVTAKDFKDTKLYFDRGTGLLVKTSRKGLAPSMGDPTEVLEDTLLSDDKKIDGLMTPMKMLVNHDGKKFMTVIVTETKLTEKGDAKGFEIRE